MKKALGAIWIVALAVATTAVAATSHERFEVESEAPEVPEEADRSADNLVLITIDGVRWQEIFQGLDPNFAKGAHLARSAYPGPRALLPNMYKLFFDGGVAIGDPRLPGGISASGPRCVSLPGYVEIVTGAPSTCRSNDCVPVLGETLADAFAAAGGSRESVAVFGSWEQIAAASAADRGRIVLRAGKKPRDEPPPFPGVGAYQPDHFTASAAMEHLERHRPRFLWVALGDTDEWAHRGDYRGYVDALRSADAFLGELVAKLGELGDYGARTLVMVTTDHGREAGFGDHGGKDSAPVWLLARGPRVPALGAVSTSRRRYLKDIAPTARMMTGLPPRACAGCGEPIDEIVSALAP